MKSLNPKSFTFYLLLSLLLTTSMKCKKDETGIEALPPSTQEGKNTFGCLVNGEAFTPKGSNLGGPVLSSFYQYSNTSTAQGYFFNVSAIRVNGSGNGTEGVNINTNNKTIIEGQKYVLENGPENGQIYGSYGITISTKSNEFITKGSYKGELFLSKFDKSKQIASGTFWFDAVNEKGEKVEVREGRFDVKYVQ